MASMSSPTLAAAASAGTPRSEEHTSELQSPCNLVCRLLLEKKKHCTCEPCTKASATTPHPYKITSTYVESTPHAKGREAHNLLERWLPGPMRNIETDLVVSL